MNAVQEAWNVVMSGIKGELGSREKGEPDVHDALQKFLSLREDKQIKDQVFKIFQESIQKELLVEPSIQRERRFGVDFSVILSFVCILFAIYKYLRYRGNKNLNSFKQLAGYIICLNFFYILCVILPDIFVGIIPFVLCMNVLPESKVLELFPVYNTLSSPNVVRVISSCFFIFYGALSTIIFRFFNCCLRCNELLSLQRLKKYQNERLGTKEKKLKKSAMDFIKTFAKYASIIILAGFLPQRLVFNSTPMFVSFGRKEILEAGYFFDRPMIFSYNGVRWCLKLDHIFYIFLWISLCYHIIPKLSSMSLSKSWFSLLRRVLYASLPVSLFICMWLVCFFKDLFLNVFMLILLRKCGYADYILRPNNVLTMKALHFFMTETRFPDCVIYPTVFSPQESEDQLTEYFSYLASNFYNLIILLTFLFFVILPAAVWLIVERRSSKYQGNRSKKGIKKRVQ